MARSVGPAPSSSIASQTAPSAPRPAHNDRLASTPLRQILYGSATNPILSKRMSEARTLATGPVSQRTKLLRRFWGAQKSCSNNDGERPTDALETPAGAGAPVS